MKIKEIKKTPAIRRSRKKDFSLLLTLSGRHNVSA